MGSNELNSSLDLSVEDFLSHRFTHVIVGGGTAGLTVAARLAEDPSITVGVLEAGSPAYHEPSINVPGRFGETLGTKYDWQFETTPQPEFGGRKLPFPRGKVLGGTSALNFMTWNRGCREDYDAWEKMGCEGWGWEGLLPFFKKSEHFHRPSVEHQRLHRSYHNEKFHGAGGLLQTAYSSQYGVSHQHWHATMKRIGIDTNKSHLSGSNVGCWTSLTSVDPLTRERSYSANAYLSPFSNRPNLHVLTEATVQNLVLEREEEKWIAKGACFTHSGAEYVVPVTRGEVILCGGSVSSSQILELSGVGSPEILGAAGIEVKVGNPNVGEHLQEHMMTAMVFEIDPSITTMESVRSDPSLLADAQHEYSTAHAGILTTVPSSVAYLPFSFFTPISRLSSLVSSLPDSSPQQQHRHYILLNRFGSFDQRLGQIEYNFDLSNYNPYFPSEPGKRYATMLMMLQYPFSAGSIHIPPASNRNPTSVNDKPVIDPKYFAGPGGKVDLATMIESQKFGEQICKTKPLADIIVKRVFPPEQEVEEVQWETWIRNTTLTDWHPVGTCSMVGGRKGREVGVVDERLRVFGVEGLRVCDASVMPLQISAHLQATVYAIAEKGAEIIKEDWRARKGKAL